MNMVQMAAKMQDCNDTAKSFYGDKYDEKIKPIKEAINRLSEQDGKGVLPAAIKLAQLNKENGMVSMMIFSAAVDMVGA
jgi:hypothetical protein